jgi:prepilin-type N-terminal cleavage/methylation domain-containing protein
MIRGGFTLVELLVVVSIIVLLLALLLPAMGKAVYQADLTVCSARQKSVVSAVLQYTFDNKRYYPTRGVKDQNSDGFKFFNPMQVYNFARNYDLRAGVKDYVTSVNRQLQCSLIDPIDMENVDVDEVVESSYLFFWGWTYVVNPPEDGMFKVGDGFTWDGRTYTFLIMDMDVDYHGALTQASHPDRQPKQLSPVIWDKFFAFGANFTLSRWSANGRNRGFLDTNYGYDDGSVRRFTDVLQFIKQGANRPDERFENIPLEFDRINPNDVFHAPRQ